MELMSAVGSPACCICSAIVVAHGLLSLAVVHVAGAMQSTCRESHSPSNAPGPLPRPGAETRDGPDGDRCVRAGDPGDETTPRCTYIVLRHDRPSCGREERAAWHAARALPSFNCKRI
eukprot:scaffold81445_cov66-Phaeocystis_antarctica.AAC.5